MSITVYITATKNANVLKILAFFLYMGYYYNVYLFSEVQKMKLKKSLSVILCLLIVFSMFGICANAAITGNGTKSSPYKITSQADLVKLAENVNAGESYSGKYFTVTANITLTADHTPIGTKTNPFSGIFDGGNKTISSVTVYADDYAGLFGYIKNATVSNVNIKNGYFDISTSYAGGIAAYAVNSKIENCRFSGDVYGNNYVGGIVGMIESGSIKNCSTDASAFVIGYTKYTGGIAGSCAAAVSDCTNNASVEGRTAVGGIVGEATASTITSCINNGSVTATSKSCAGIAGTTKANITLCVNKGNISGNGSTGGIAGTSTKANISFSYNAAAISNGSANYCAGLVGSATNGSISNCYNEGKVTSKDKYYAGIFGYSMNTAVSSCYNAGSSTGAGIGGYSAGTNTNVYWLSSSASKAFSSSAGTNTNCVSLTAAKMKDKNNFTGFDFTKNWEITGRHSDYPTLKAIEYHSFTYLNSTAPTCTKKGYDTYICLECQYSYNVDTLDKIPHKLSQQSLLPATCTQTGTKTLACSACSYTETVTLEALGHIDENRDGVCDDCLAKVPLSSDTNQEKELTFWQKIVQAFKRFFDWIESLFNF